MFPEQLKLKVSRYLQALSPYGVIFIFTSNYFKNIYLNKLFVSLFLLILAGCSVLNQGTETAPSTREIKSASRISSVRLYLAKGNFLSTEFEQFSLSSRALFYECGRIRRGKNIPQQQGLIEISEDASSQLVLLAMEILGRASISDPLSLSTAPEAKKTEAGKVILNLNTKDNKSAQLVTGLNEITDPATSLENNILKLSINLRAEVKNSKGSSSLCDNQEFYGIE